MIVKTDGVVLRSMKYRETSKILRLYTRRFGKISVVAKGARDPKSKFASKLEPMNYVSCVIYKKEHRDLQLLTQCDLIKPFPGLTEDLERMAAGMTVIELLDAVTHSEEENEPLFALVVRVLDAINGATKRGSTALYFFEMRLSEILGFRPSYHRCSLCSNSVVAETPGSRIREFHLGFGGVLCGSCARRGTGSRMISAAGLKVLQRLQELDDLEPVMRIGLAAGLRDEVGTTLRQHLQNHVEGLRGLRSEDVFAAIS